MGRAAKPVLGINGCQDTFHDASSTVINGGKVTASVEEERFNRIKHSRGMPHMSMDKALAISDLDLSDIGGVGYYLDPWELLGHYFLDPVKQNYPQSFELFQAMPFYLDFLRSRSLIRKALEVDKRVPVYYVRHHLCHAASAYYGSPFENAAVLVVDGSGESETASYYLGEGNSLKQIGVPMRYPESIGFFYEGVASHIGLGWIGGAGKLMGLAPFGKPTKFDTFMSWFDLREDGSVGVDLTKMSYYVNKSFFTPTALDVLGPPRAEHEAISQAHADLAASAQKVLEEVVVHMATCLQKRTGARALCYAGGVALNIDANTELFQRAGFEEVYIMPAAYDGGTSVGAAFATHFKVNPKAERPEPLLRADHGTSYSDVEIEAALHRAGLDFVKLPTTDLIDRISERLADQAVVGWYQGRMEYGPRALGFRSILADPRLKGMADYLNVCVKGREPYRPFAPAVPLDVADDYFDVCAPSPFMLYKFDVLAKERHRLGAITHVDGSARAQTVTAAENEIFHELLTRFGERTGVAVLLNTSFNLGGEPLVETPDQAISSFRRSGMDLLVLNNYLVDAGETPGFARFEGLPALPPGTIMSASEPRGKNPVQEPKRFGLEPASWQQWMSASIEKKGAAGFFKPLYNRAGMAGLSALARIGSAFDGQVISEVKSSD